MNDRLLNLEGTSNFRDLGGYEAGNGMRLRKGLIYRSDSLSYLTQSDFQKIQKIGIKTVCDFRSEIEMKDSPSPFSSKTSPRLFHLPIKTLGTQDLKELATKENVTSQELADELQDHYTLYVNQHKNTYSKFINMIANEEIPIVFHCFAGKDRTGYGALLFLSIIGVKKETIIEDYLLTNKFFKGPRINESWRNDSSELLKPLFEARTNYINAAFNEIYNKYDKVEDFVVKELGIDVKTIDTIKERVLE
ncbi:MAG: tyrosine-protein phosphatase [Alphaproteobacteria bacterium]